MNCKYCLKDNTCGNKDSPLFQESCLEIPCEFSVPTYTTCSVCGQHITLKAGYYCICDAYVLSNYIKDESKNVFCSPLCLCRAMSVLRVAVDEDGKEQISLA